MSGGTQNPDRDREIARAYQSGSTLRDLGAAWRLSHERIRQVLDRERCPRRARGQRATATVGPFNAPLVDGITDDRPAGRA